MIWIFYCYLHIFSYSLQKNKNRRGRRTDGLYSISLTLNNSPRFYIMKYASFFFFSCIIFWDKSLTRWPTKTFNSLILLETTRLYMNHLMYSLSKKMWIVFFPGGRPLFHHIIINHIDWNQSKGGWIFSKLKWLRGGKFKLENIVVYTIAIIIIIIIKITL